MGAFHPTSCRKDVRFTNRTCHMGKHTLTPIPGGRVRILPGRDLFMERLKKKGGTPPGSNRQPNPHLHGLPPAGSRESPNTFLYGAQKFAEKGGLPPRSGGGSGPSEKGRGGLLLKPWEVGGPGTPVRRFKSRGQLSRGFRSADP